MENKINIAVIGVGYWGPNLVRTFLELPAIEKVVIYDLDRKRAEAVRRKYPSVIVAESLEQIFNDQSISAVSIATPVTTHFELAQKALLCGKHVLVEKPLAVNSLDCLTLVKLAKEQGRVLMAGHILEYKPAVARIRQIIESGELGEVLYITASRLNLGLISSDVSVLWDAAVHDIYVINFLLGRCPQKISAAGTSYRDYTGTSLESVAFLTLDYGNNILASIHINWLSPLKIRQMMVCGTKKMLVYDDIEQVEPLKIYDRGVVLKPQSELSAAESSIKTDAKHLTGYRLGDTVIPHIANNDEPLKIECQHFIDCILKNLAPQSSGETALKVVQILETAEESLKNQSKFIDIRY